MTKDIEPKLKLISTYLKISIDELFIIPEYQRSYSWTILECDKLWQDIEAFMESAVVNESGKKEPYFFGTVIADCSNSGKLSLIDGQQRTTTFILLLRALLLRIQEVLSKMSRDGDAEALFDALKERRNRIVDILYKTDADNRLELLRNWEDEARKRKMLESKSINELPEYKLDLQSIVGAKDYEAAERGCYKIPRKQKDNKYTNFFRNFKFFHNKLADYSETQVNSFAKTFLDECQIIEIRSWNTEQAITMFNSLNSTGMPLSDADIISAQLYSKAGDDQAQARFMEMWEDINKVVSSLSSRKIVNIDSLLQQYMYIRRAKDKDYVRDGQPDVTTPGLRRYYTVEKKHLLADPIGFCSDLEKIAHIWDKIKDCPRVKLILKFNENAKLYLIAYLNRYDPEKIDEILVTPVAECLIRLFTILELVDYGYSSTRFKTFLFGEAVKLVDANIPVNTIVQDFDRHIVQNWNREDILSSLRAYEKNVLVFLNEYLYAKCHGYHFDFSDSVNIEHIMPASGHNIDTIRLDAGIATREEFASIVNKLGNKALLEEDINKSIGRDWFKTKKQKSITDKKGYKDSRYHIVRSLTEYPSDRWDESAINDATNKAAERIADFVFGA